MPVISRCFAHTNFYNFFFATSPLSDKRRTHVSEIDFLRRVRQLSPITLLFAYVRPRVH